MVNNENEQENKVTKAEEVNAMLEEDEPRSEEDIQDAILDDMDMTNYQKWVAKLDDKKFVLYQRIAGVMLGILASVALFWDLITNTQDKNAFSWGLIIAVVIALWVPKIIEKKCLRKMQSMRSAMAIALAVIIAGYFLYVGFTSGWSFRTKKTEEPVVQEETVEAADAEQAAEDGSTETVTEIEAPDATAQAA